MPDQETVALGELLRALSDELIAMSETTERLQSLLGAAWAAAPDNPGFHGDAQACDLVTQRLHAAALFIADVGKETPATWLVDVAEATRRCRLSDLAAKLSGRTLESAEQSAGDLLMF